MTEQPELRKLTFEDSAMKAPSHALRLALADLVVAENDPNYTVDLGRFFQVHHGKCVVCVAGSTMAEAEGWPEPESVKEPLDPTDFSDRSEWVLNFIDFVARGGYEVPAGDDHDLIIQRDDVPHLDATFETGFTNGIYTDLLEGPLADGVRYDRDPTAYKRWFADVADWLEARGY